MELTDAVVALAALAQDTRLAAFRALVAAGPHGLAAGRLAEQLGVPAATLSFHLKELANAGLIAGQQTGRLVIYTARFDAMNALLGFLTRQCCQGQPADCFDVNTEARASRRPRPQLAKPRAAKPAARRAMAPRHAASK